MGAKTNHNGIIEVDTYNIPKSKWAAGVTIIKKLMQAFNWSPEQASALAGVIYCEGGWNPAAVMTQERSGTFSGTSEENKPKLASPKYSNFPNGQSGYGAGLAQWTFENRKGTAISYANKTLGKAIKNDQVELAGLDFQIQMIIEEFKHTRGNLADQIRNTTNILDAVDLVLRGYENGGGGKLASKEFIDKYTWAGGYEGSMESRGGAAMAAYKIYCENEGLEYVEPDPQTASSNITVPNISNLQQPSNNSVWSFSNDNIYQSVTVNNQNISQPKLEHTRIYMYQDKTIECPKMSISLNMDIAADNTVDQSTGLYNGTQNLNINSDDVVTKGNKTVDYKMDIGFSFPLIKINDHMYTHNDIKKCVISTTSFIPTIELLLETNSNDILKNNSIKDGDIIQVFINPGHGMIKSYRADYIINNAMVLKQDQSKRNIVTTVLIEGELFIPNLYNSGLVFSYPGTSRDALIDAATKLGLGFYFCDADNTEDTQLWYCTADDEEVNGSMSPAIKYIKYVSSHAWKNFNSFYDCWIDLRYGLTFLNINKMLGEDGLDEQVDVAFFNSAISQSKAANSQNAELTDSEKKNDPKPQAKILSNIGKDTDSITSFFVKSFSEIYAGGEVSRELGILKTISYDVQNAGLQNSGTNVDLNISIPLNQTKLQHGFYALVGPGINNTYVPADNGSYVEQHKVVSGGGISTSQSDTDAQEIQNSASNSLTSGNTHKFYEAAEQHNYFNNKILEKKMIKVVLNGCNMQIMRGEKIPMILEDKQFGMNLIGINENNAVNKKIFEQYSGWFIIKSLKWIYDATKPVKQGTAWETEIVLTRREWPIIGWNKKELTSDQQKEIITVNNPNEGTLNESTNVKNSENTDNNYKESETVTDGITTNGLKDFIITIYNDIKAAVATYKDNGKIMLISGKRWAADENNNKIDGQPTVKDGTLWKFINANGDIVWYSSNTSKHLYGEAIDIINNKGIEFADIAIAILNDKQTLYDMFINGVYCAIEVSKDDTGNTIKHYHIGTVDQSDSTSIASQKTWWEEVILFNKNNILTLSSGKSINLTSYASYN